MVEGQSVVFFKFDFFKISGGTRGTLNGKLQKSKGVNKMTLRWKSFVKLTTIAMKSNKGVHRWTQVLVFLAFFSFRCFSIPPLVFVENESIANVSSVNITATSTRAYGPQGRHQSVCDTLSSSKAKKVNYQQETCRDVQLGNVFPRIVMTYAMAYAEGAFFSFSCNDEKEGKEKTILNWMAHNPYLFNHKSMHQNTSLRDLCTHCNNHHPHTCSKTMPHLVPWIRQTLQGLPAVSRKEEVDIAIHYRCGDILGIRNDKYGLLPHATYRDLIQKRHLPEKNISIVIITQSLNDKNSRSVDRKHFQICRILSGDLQNYLQLNFPKATVSIGSFGIYQAYSEIVHAKSMSICGPSTFCLWPTLASNNPFIYQSRLFPWISSSANINGRVYTSSILHPRANQSLQELPLHFIRSWLQNTSSLLEIS
jgi:hypothetical protein